MEAVIVIHKSGGALNQRPYFDVISQYQVNSG